VNETQTNETKTPPEHLLQFFQHEHVPPETGALAEIRQRMDDLARDIVATMPRNPERTVAIRALLDSRTAVGRAYGAK
jgi:hypothetical protein